MGWPYTSASNSEMPHGVARVTPSTRTYRARVGAKLWTWWPAAPIVGDATVVNTKPLSDTWIR